VMGIFRAGRLRCGFVAACLALVIVLAPARIAFAEDTSIPTGTFGELSARANSLRESGKAADAIPYYQSALKLRPNWAEGWWYVGTTFYDMDRYQDAISAFHRLLELDPKLGPALAFLGLSEFETGSYENALTHLKRANIEGYGDDPELAKVAQFHLAMLLNWRGNFEEAFNLLEASFSNTRVPDSAKTAVGMAILRIPLLPSEVGSTHDALIQAAGNAGALAIQGKSDEAAEAFRQLIDEYPSAPYLHYAYARALSQANKNDEALAQVEREIKLHESALAYIEMAAIELKMHHADKALLATQKAVNLSPKSSAGHRAMARVLEENGKKEQAAHELAVSKEFDKSPAEIDHVQQRLYGDTHGEQIQRASVASKNGQVSRPEDHAHFEQLVHDAEAARAAGRWDDAIADLQRALELRPDWAEGWQDMGTLYYARGKYADAVKVLQKSAATSPRNGTVWAVMGLAEFEIKDYKNAQIHLQRGRDLGMNGNASAVQVATYHLALLLNRTGDFDQATELLTPGSGSGPANDAAKVALGIAMLRMPLLPEEIPASKISLVRESGEAAALLAESKYEQAFARLQQLLVKYPETPYLHYAYGSALLSVSQYDEAEHEMAEETKLNPESALPYRRRATIALQIRRPEEALQFAQTAVRIDPESGEGHYLLGRALLESGKTGESITELEKACGLAPNSPEVHFNMARAYAKAGKPEAAAKERAAFQELNDAVQSQRSRTGSQAYGAFQSQNGLHEAQGRTGNDNGAQAH
jgi:tetratricopeptide (TPR) repeat protein